MKNLKDYQNGQAPSNGTAEEEGAAIIDETFQAEGNAPVRTTNEAYPGATATTLG